ncbi:hypothetical protein LZS94_09495 [Aliivibrio fischeri]|uniref:hypothetical protein n=1 Tax=Aliivibrio fischeri TaxID=668 RepID=UPI001F3F9DF5|nr:hypothetical protein [Aliivibrio fischeri]MCE7577730.1 hypothetical protein [Aliivibrio fischeri]MCE7591572.1 hypothetical protein [Aliivibrio fischeri]
MKFTIPSWAALRSLGESKAVKLTCLTPLFGYGILLSDYFVSLLEQASSLLGTHDSHETALSNAYFMYFGLLFLAFGNGLYAIFAPNLIKEYKSIRHYLNDNIDYVTNSKIAGLSKHVKEKFTKKDEQPHTIFSRIDSFLSEENENSEKKLRTISIDLYSHFWNQTNYSLCLIRALTSGLFTIGFIFLIVPSIRLLLNILC